MIGVLKFCDFGFVKIFVVGEFNVFYICFRYYWVFEFIFGVINYIMNIDIWLIGCVMVELMLG